MTETTQGADNSQTQTTDQTQQTQTTDQTQTTKEAGWPDWVSDPAKAWAEIEKTRGEAARYRTQRNDFRTQLEEAQVGTETETEDQSEGTESGNASEWEKRALDAERQLRSAKRESSQLKASVQQLQVRGQVTDAASRAGFHDPGDVYALVINDLEIDSDGIINLEQTLEALSKAKPYLLKQPQTGGQRGMKVGGGENETRPGQPTANFRQFMGYDPVSPFGAGGIEFPDN